MPTSAENARTGPGRLALRARDALLGSLIVGFLKTARRFDPDRMADFAGAAMRRLGPWLPEHKTGRANLAAAYPEKSAAGIEKILSGVWDNLGRVAAEFAHLDRLWDIDAEGKGERIETTAGSIENLRRLRNSGRPALFFSAHLANWEMPALAGPAFGMRTAVLYRAPNIRSAADAVRRTRAINMGEMIPADSAAPARLAAALQGGSHAGMLVDQHFGRGVPVTFFGRPAFANPMIARLARRTGCAIHGLRIVRLPNHRFRVELTDAIECPSGEDGLLDPAATMQRITGVIEGWIREHPEQWLWLHRRWR